MPPRSPSTTRTAAETADAVSGRRAALRNAVLDAAEQRVAAAGLSALSIRELAAAAGCAVGMVYKLFADQDALLLAVNARTLDALAAVLDAAAADAPDPRTALRRAALAYGDYAARHTPRWDALFSHRMSAGAPLPDDYRARRDQLFDRVSALLGGPDGGGGNTIPARTLFSAVHGVVALGLAAKLDDAAPDTLRDDLSRLATILADGLSMA